MKKILVLLLFFIVCNYIFAQQFIQTTKVFGKKTKFEFSNEWQYVSTDLYLFNSSRFNSLINSINPENKKKKNRDVIKNILVTVQLEGMGELDKLTYPLFNFVVTENENGDLVAQVSEPDVIRIVDNFPIASLKDYIGAKVNVAIYSDKNKSDVYKFIAEQLSNVSSFTTFNTTDAALKVVGEIGKFMKSDASGKQYQFESTIRFYEDQNFNRRFHSISVFAFHPSTIKQVAFDTVAISRFLDTTKVPTLEKQTLKKYLTHTNYPYIVAINYRSKYIPKISDDINFDMLKMRFARNEMNYENKLISRDVYLQEKSLIDFLEIYAQFLLDLNKYELDYKAKITEDFTIQLFIVMQDYWKMLNTNKTLTQTFAGNPLYETEFKPLYKRYLTQTSIKFETNSALRGVREHVETIYELENTNNLKLDSLKRESYLQKLKVTKLPPREAKSEEVLLTQKWILNIEKDLFTYFYLPKINLYSKLPVSNSSFEIIQKIYIESTTSNCDLCKEKISVFYNDFLIKYENFLLQTENILLNKTKQETQLKILDFSKRQNIIKINLQNQISSESNEHLILLDNLLQESINQRNKLNELISSKKTYTNYKEVKLFNDEILILSNTIEINLLSICNTNPELCKSN